MQAWGAGSREKRSEVPFLPRPLALSAHSFQRPPCPPGRYHQGRDSSSWTRLVTCRTQALGVCREWLPRGRGLGRPLRLREREQVGHRLGGGCHVGPPHPTMYWCWEHQLWGVGGAPEVSICHHKSTSGVCALRHRGEISPRPQPRPPQPWMVGKAVTFSSPTVTFGCLTTGSAGRGRVGGLGRSASAA